MFEERFHEAVNQAECELFILATITAGLLIVATKPYRLNLTSAECSHEAQALFPMSMIR